MPETRRILNARLSTDEMWIILDEAGVVPHIERDVRLEQILILLSKGCPR